MNSLRDDRTNILCFLCQISVYVDNIFCLCSNYLFEVFMPAVASISEHILRLFNYFIHHIAVLETVKNCGCKFYFIEKNGVHSEISFISFRNFSTSNI